MEEETDNGNQRGKNYLLPNHSKLYSSSLCLELSQHVKNLSRKRISKKMFHRHITRYMGNTICFSMHMHEGDKNRILKDKPQKIRCKNCATAS